MRQPRSCRSTRMTSNVSIIASVGLRTSPYRLNTGMPCTGSLKVGNSIMLSCLSPRRPCCGPKAAMSLMSSHAAKASSECVKSSVTEAGCASNATRLPLSGARKAGSAISRSIPNFMVATVGKIHAQSNRNDGNPPCPVDAPTPSMIYGHWFPRSRPRDRGAIQHHRASPTTSPAPARPAMSSTRGSIAPRSAAHRARPHLHPTSVAAETIGRPLCRGRKVEFVIRGAGRTADECLEAGVPPQLIGTRGRHRRRHAQIAYFAAHEIGKQQTAGVWTRDVHFNVCHCGAKRIRMKSQRLVHAGNVAQQVASLSESERQFEAAPGPKRTCR